MFTYVLCIISHYFIGILAQTTEPVTTLRPLDERTCVAGFVCKHGHCVKSNFLECVCDPGWIGIFCEKSCSLDCGQHGKCMIYNEKPTCVCDWRYTGTFCDEIKSFPTTTTASVSPNVITNITDSSTPVPQNISTTTQPVNITTTISTVDQGQLSSSTTSSPSTSTTSSHSSTTSSSTTIVPPPVSSTATQITPSAASTETQTKTSIPTTPPATVPATSTISPNRTECFPGFVCQHGHCPDGRLICICDEGWVGPFCEWVCDLDCGDNGHCNTYGDDNLFCDCKPGYMGDNCEILESTASETTITTTISQTTTIPVFLLPQTPRTTNDSTNLKLCNPGFTCIIGICNKTDTKPSCICESGYIGLLCEKKCPITCDVNEICELRSNGSAFCRCNTVTKCKELRPDPNELRGDEDELIWYWYLLGACLVLVLLLILLVVIPYCMWKRREIFIMKIMYMFQPYEDDDDKLFDAFISYKSTAKDEDFVLRQLFPRLETENNFKLCLHFRDFIPGETISNNIKWAVENSRRTILILTPDYIQSELCRFEYQRAQQEMMKRKKRIIPIILEDVSNQMNYMSNSLRSIVKSITYLRWPGEKNETNVNKFWKRLELSLPKKRQERNLGKKKGKSKPDNVRLRRFSKDIRPSNTDDSDFVRLSIDDESILNGFRSSRDANSMTVLM